MRKTVTNSNQAVRGVGILNHKIRAFNQMIMNNVKISDNAILNLSFNFSLDIIDFTEQLEEKKKYVVARQLLRSGTSIGANIREAQSAESNTDFILKMKVADKEADETGYWLLLCKHAPSYPPSKELLERHMEIKKLLGKIISTSRGRTPGEGHHQVHG